MTIAKKTHKKSHRKLPRKQMVGIDVVAEELQLAIMSGVSLRERRILLVGDIDEEAFAKFLTVFTVLDAFNAPINITFNTDGGSMEHGIGIFDIIKASKNPITIDVMGEVKSIGVLILQSADKRRMTINGRLMIHQGSLFTVGENQFKASEIGEHAKDLEEKNDKYYEIIANGTKGKMSKKDVKMACRKDTFFTAEQALEKGLIDEIIPLGK